jgi:ketosteroid isomerase-like protein
VSQEPATQHLEEKVRRFIEEFVDGDFESAVTIYAPDAVQDMSTTGLGTFAGHHAIREFFEVWRGPYENLELELKEFHDLGNGVSLSVLAQRARLPGSSVFFSVRGGWVGVWRGGLIERNTVYQDLDQARADAERLAEERR